MFLEPSPLLLKASDESVYDGEESRDTLMDTMTDSLNTSLEEVPAAVEKTPKRVASEELHSTPAETKKKGKTTGRRTQISGYIVYSGEIRKTVQQENPDCTFGEISRIVGGKWRNLEKEEKEKYEEKAKKIAEEQQAKQEAAEKAFNESLNKTQQQQNQWNDYSGSGPSNRPGTPGSQGYQPGFYQPYSGAQPGQFPMQVQPPPQGMHNGVAVSPYMARGPVGSPGMTPPAGPQGQRPPYVQPFQPQPRQPMGPYQGTTQQMAPPPPPPRPPSPMFVTVPQRTQRLLHSEAYLKYIEGLSSDSRTVSDWDRNLTATQENTQTPDENRLPSHWLAQGSGYHGNVTNALWALRDVMLKDTLNIQRTLPFEAL